MIRKDVGIFDLQRNWLIESYRQLQVWLMRIKYLQHLKKLTVTQLKPTSTSVTPRRIIPFQKVFFKSENVSIDFRFFRTLPHNLWQGIPADPTLCEDCRVVCNELPLVPSRSTAMPISGSRPPPHRPSGGIVGILPLWEDWLMLCEFNARNFKI
jgi:hypothetical protein